MNRNFFEVNRERLGEKIEDKSMVVLFSGAAPKKSADEYYDFTTNRNFYYLCGIKEPEIMLILVKEGQAIKSTLFIKEANPVLEKWVGKTISKEEAISISQIDDIKYVDAFENVLHQMFVSNKINHLYLNLEIEGFKAPLTKEQIFANECTSRYPFISVKNVYPIIASLRMIKAPYEIEKLKEAIKVTDEGIRALMKNAQSGIMEYALEAHFDFVLKCNGIKDYAFKTIAASGINATILHYSSNDTLIKKDSLVLFDLGAQYDYYNADITRTIPAEGKFTERQKTLYNIVLKANEAVIEAIEPGVPFTRLNEIVKEIYFEELQKLGMVSTMEEVGKYYYHGVSHSLGLDTHDVWDRNVELEAGMVLTVEPGLYIEEEEIGIRIEDDVLVTTNGCEVLSKDIIKTVSDIEAFMQS